MNRRAFCTAIGGSALLGALPRMPFAQSTGQQVPYSSGTELPKLKAPPNACDCHMHIYDSRFPAAPTATLKPPDALVPDYQLLQKRIGTTRVVVVTPSTYGTDNRCTVDAIAKFGASTRGVAVVDTSISDAELKRLADVGVRGIRFNLTIGAVTTPDMIEPLSRRIADLGWHVQLNIAPKQLLEMQDRLQHLPTPMVFDHLARIPLPAGVDDPAFGAVATLIDQGRAWVKLSGAYIGSKVGPPTYADASKVAEAYVKLAPERVVWGSDWPHPTEQKEKPDDAVLFDLLATWVPDEATRKKILVDNPAALYGFPKAS
jgi:D-galactarolactone isomerase